MRTNVATGWKLYLILLVAAVLAWYGWKKMPPYQRGVHTAEAKALTSPSAGNGPHIGNCSILPKDNVWNTPVDRLRRDQRSDVYLASIGLTHKVHPDFGTDPTYGIPFTEVPSGTRLSPVEFTYHDDSDLGSYPIPPNPPIEGGAHSKTDRHILMIDLQRCFLYELLAAEVQRDGSWKADAGVRIDLTSNALRAEGKTSADAAGLPILPGLVRYDEVISGEINHALRFTVPRTQAAYIWPARHKASNSTDANLPPMGLRLRLRADFDISKYSKSNQVIMMALKRYGMFLADNGGPMFITGVADKRWDDGDLRKLGEMTTVDFEAVDESAWQMLPDSGRVDPVERK